MQVRCGGAVCRLKTPLACLAFVIGVMFLGTLMLSSIDVEGTFEENPLKGISRKGRNYNEVPLGRSRGRRPIDEDDTQVIGNGNKIDEPLWILSPNQEKLKSNTGPMVMQLVSGEKRKEFLQKQREIIKNQKRPADSIYNLNVTLSDGTSMDRPIMDTRPEVCRNFVYDVSKLPHTSVVIPFYNEALSMLLRTIHSILNRTPDRLLDEVIVVDDKSTHEHLQQPLTEYLALLPKVRLIRNERREGLIKSRMIGARSAKSPIVVFLDAHTEANRGWLEPLLIELEKHPNSIVQPFVDGIEASNLAYTGPPSIYKGSFSWDLRYTWLKVADHIFKQVYETGIPFFSPTLVGCAIAVNMTYFNEIGTFDEDLKVWGGENIELAFRTWMCGGQVVTVPCARVGHVFKNFPYKFDGNKETIVEKNLMRVADTWMEGMRKYFYASTRVYDFKRAEFTDEEKASLEKRKELRKKLNCKNFDWYMHNIIPEVEPPPMDAVYYGEIMSLRSRACFEVTEDMYVGMTYICYEHKIIPKNNFFIDKNGLLRYKDKCVTYDNPTPILYVAECPTKDFEQFGTWSIRNEGVTWGGLYTQKVNPDTGVVSHWCIVQVTNVLPQHKGEQMPQLGNCDKNDEFQKWSFTYKFDYEAGGIS